MNKRKKRVTHFSTVHNANDTRIIDKECLSLVQAGYDVTFVARYDMREMKYGVLIIPLESPKNIVDRLFLSTIKIFRIIRQTNADLYHFHDPELIPVGLLLKALGNKVIYDVHEDYEEFFKARDWLTPFLKKAFSFFWWQFEKFSCYFFDYIIVVAQNWRDKFPQKNAEVISNVPPLRFITDHSPRKNKDVFKLVYVGTLDKFRGIDIAIDSLPFITKMKVELHIMGALKNPAQLDLFNRQPQVRYHGRVPWHKLREALDGADAGLLLLRPDSLNLNTSGENNTKLFEYMSAGVPVIFSDFPRLRAFIDGLGAGLAVDPTNPRKIAEAVEFLYENPAIRKEMGANGIKAVIEQYNWEAQEEKLLKVYEYVLSN